MKWVSPDRNYTFLIKRVPNNLWGGNESEYIINIDILNNVGVRLYTLRTTEVGMITVISSLLEFTDYYMGEEFGMYNSHTITFDPAPDNTSSTLIVSREDIYGKVMENTSTAFEPCPYREETNKPYSSFYFNELYDEYREILLRIDNYNPFQETLVPVVATYLSDMELEELSFILFFETLIDIDVPPRYMSDMEYITHRFTVNGLYETVTPEMLNGKRIP